MASRAVLHMEELYFPDCKNKIKIKRRYLVIGDLNELK
jgi:hypothetical protein